MKQLKRNLDNDSDLSHIVNTLRSVLNNKTCDVEVVIQERKETRRDIQNKLYWHWVAECMVQNQLHGMEEEEFVKYNKYNIGLRVLCKREGFREKIEYMNALTYEQRISLMEYFDVTKIMTVKEMALYLTDFKLQWNKVGVMLTDKDDLQFKALGRNI